MQEPSPGQNGLGRFRTDGHLEQDLLKGGWGEHDNHSALMHPIEKDMDNINKYTIISESQQAEHKK
eukprot:5151481-Heterocapsa_arctica.AAC.1